MGTYKRKRARSVTRKRLTRKARKKTYFIGFFALAVLFIFSVFFYSYFQNKEASTRAQSPKKYSLQAKYKVGMASNTGTSPVTEASLVSLSNPIYLTDYYMGAWKELDEQNLNYGNCYTHHQLRWTPNKNIGSYYIGDYSAVNFGNRDTIRKRLTILKNAKLYPAIHILTRHLVYQKKAGETYYYSTADYGLKNWQDYGVINPDNGTYLTSIEAYNYLYKPILKELKLPYILMIDMWGIDNWVFSTQANGCPAFANTIPVSKADQYEKLWWSEFMYLYNNLGLNKKDVNDYQIYFREYTFNTSAYWPVVAVMSPMNGRYLATEGTVCSDATRIGFVKTAGNPGGTGKSPYSATNYDWLNAKFWLVWAGGNGFTNSVRNCPTVKANNNGLWNMAVFDSVSTDLTTSQSQNNSAESFDNEGPRYFYGYVNHFHDTSAEGRHWYTSGGSFEKTILTTKAQEKGLVFVGIWNDYEETAVMEPANLGPLGDTHNPWVNGPTQLNNYLKARGLPIPNVPTPTPKPTYSATVKIYLNNSTSTAVNSGTIYDKTATVTITGPVSATKQWPGTQGISPFTGLLAGSYKITITNLPSGYVATTPVVSTNISSNITINLGVKQSSTTPTPSGQGDGLKGEYFNSKGIGTNLSFTRTDPAINFRWGLGAPGSGVSADLFSVRWTGYIIPKYSQTYTFYTYTDDGARLWVNNKLIIDRWIAQPETEVAGSVYLSANKKYPIRIDYFDNYVGATAVLKWSSASTPKQIIPQGQLYSK